MTKLAPLLSTSPKCWRAVRVNIQLGIATVKDERRMTLTLDEPALALLPNRGSFSRSRLTGTSVAVVGEE